MLEIVFACLKAALYAAALLGGGIALASASLRVEASAGLAGVRRAAGLALAFSACALSLVFVQRLGGYWDLATLQQIFVAPLGLGLALQAVGGAALVLAKSGQGAVLGAIIVIAGFAASGHAAARGLGPATIILLHVATAAWWTGGVMLLLHTSRQVQVEAYARLVNLFSQQALILVGLLVAAGAATTFVLLGGLPDLAHAYDKALVLKIAIAAAVLTLAAINKFVLTPGLNRPDGLAWFRGALRAELVLLLGVAGATAFMTTFTSPHERAPRPPEQVVATFAGLSIIDPWVTVASATAQSAGYLTIRNESDVADVLLEVTSPRAAKISIHEMSMDGDFMRMRRLERLEIPAGQTVTLARGGLHLMLEDLQAPLDEDDSVPVTLRFAHRGRIDFEIPVKARFEGGHGHD